MWIAGPDYFVSIVAADDRAPGHLVVRARRREHLEHFLSDIGLVPDIEEDVTGTRDYRFRAVLPRQDVKVLLAHHVNRLDYHNFKDEADRRDPELGDMYHDWWVQHWGIQQRHHGKEK